MDPALTEYFFQLAVTAETQVLDRSLEQALEPCDMGVMAGETVSGRSRFMTHPLLEIVAVMAIETVYGRFATPRDSQKHDKCGNGDHYSLERSIQKHY
jgi:hypothetical protein